MPPWLHFFLRQYRNQVETTGSMIERLLPKSIHAVTTKGFELLKESLTRSLLAVALMLLVTLPTLIWKKFLNSRCRNCGRIRLPSP
jgi:hypothetical protein